MCIRFMCYKSLCYTVTNVASSTAIMDDDGPCVFHHYMHNEPHTVRLREIYP